MQGDAKEWFKHLQPKSISNWEESFDIFLKFWGKRRPLDQILSDFYSMKKQEGETMSSFNRRFQDFTITCQNKSNLLKTLLNFTMQLPFLLNCHYFFWRESQSHCSICLLIVWRLKTILGCLKKLHTKAVVIKWKIN